MNRTEKEAHVKALSDEFQSLKNAILIDYRGLNVVNATELRREIHKLSSKYVVVKNTLARKAVKDTHLEALTEFFRDPTAIAFCVWKEAKVRTYLTTANFMNVKRSFVSRNFMIFAGSNQRRDPPT